MLGNLVQWRSIYLPRYMIPSSFIYHIPEHCIDHPEKSIKLLQHGGLDLPILQEQDIEVIHLTGFCIFYT